MRLKLPESKHPLRITVHGAKTTSTTVMASVEEFDAPDDVLVTCQECKGKQLIGDVITLQRVNHVEPPPPPQEMRWVHPTLAPCDLAYLREQPIKSVDRNGVPIVHRGGEVCSYDGEVVRYVAPYVRGEATANPIEIPGHPCKFIRLRDKATKVGIRKLKQRFAYWERTGVANKRTRMQRFVDLF